MLFLALGGRIRKKKEKKEMTSSVEFNMRLSVKGGKKTSKKRGKEK